MVVRESDPRSQLQLPPGFRFYPTDEELLVQYLCRKVSGHHFSLQIIGEIDLYKFDPWDLPNKALFGEKEWYFFSPRDRKYPNGSRPNRVAGTGYWKATGTDKIITMDGRKVGIKKALVFYVGKAPKGTKTNWIMHEYRLSEPSRKNGSKRLDDWVLCRIYEKNSSAAQKAAMEVGPSSSASIPSQYYGHGDGDGDDVLGDNLPEINERLFNLPSFKSLLDLEEEADQKPFYHRNMGGFLDYEFGSEVVQQEPQEAAIGGFEEVQSGRVNGLAAHSFSGTGNGGGFGGPFDPFWAAAAHY